MGKLLTRKIENISYTKLGSTAMEKINDSQRDNYSLVLSLHFNETKITSLWYLTSLGIIVSSKKILAGGSEFTFVAY